MCAQLINSITEIAGGQMFVLESLCDTFSLFHISVESRASESWLLLYPREEWMALLTSQKNRTTSLRVHIVCLTCRVYSNYMAICIWIWGIATYSAVVAWRQCVCKLSKLCIEGILRKSYHTNFSRLQYGNAVWYWRYVTWLLLNAET